MKCAIDVVSPAVGGSENGRCNVIVEGSVFCDTEVRAEILLRKDRRWWADKTCSSREYTGRNIRLGLSYQTNEDVGRVYTEVRVKNGPKQQSARRSIGNCYVL